MRAPTQICRGFTDEQWRGLRGSLDNGDEMAWRCAIEVFERRIKERFLSCIEGLMDADSRSDIEIPPGAPPDCSTLPDDRDRRVLVPGFAIMALCCLLIETLQSFREAPPRPVHVVGPCPYPKGDCIRPASSTTEFFRSFLRLPSFRGEFDDDRIAKSFIYGVRNGILHEAETREWIIWRDEPSGRILEPRDDGHVLNRNEFYDALRREFENYLRELRDPSNVARRSRFVEKMNDIEKEC